MVGKYAGVSPDCIVSGSGGMQMIDLSLDGYETAIYEMYPVADADAPLLAGALYDVGRDGKGGPTLAVYGTGPDTRLLNPEQFAPGAPIAEVMARAGACPQPVDAKSLVLDRIGETSEMRTAFTIDPSVREASLAVLLTPGDGVTGTKGQAVLVTIDGMVDTARSEEGEGHSQWYSTPVGSGKHEGTIRLVSGDTAAPWTGRVSVWLICKQKQPAVDLSFMPRKEFSPRPMPPLPMDPGVVTRNIRLGEISL